MTFTPRMRARRRGLSLIETILAIAIGAIAVVMVVSFFQTGTSANNTNKGVQQLNYIASKMQSLHAGYATYSGDLALYQNAGVMPPGMCDDTATATACTNPWGGDVEVLPGTPDPRFFTVSYTNVPSEACINMLVGNSSNFGSGLCGVDVDGTAEGDMSCAGGGRPDISPAVAAGLCDSTAQTVTWAFQ